MYLHVAYTKIYIPYRMYTMQYLEIKTKEEYCDFAWNNYTFSMKTKMQNKKKPFFPWFNFDMFIVLWLIQYI